MHIVIIGSFSYIGSIGEIDLFSSTSTYINHHNHSGRHEVERGNSEYCRPGGNYQACLQEDR